MTEDYTERQAVADAIRLWESIVERPVKSWEGKNRRAKQLKVAWGEMDLPEHFCPLCRVWDSSISCGGCPLAHGKTRCQDYGTSFERWTNALEQHDIPRATKAAEALVRQLKNYQRRKGWA